MMGKRWKLDQWLEAGVPEDAQARSHKTREDWETQMRLLGLRGVVLDGEQGMRGTTVVETGLRLEPSGVSIYRGRIALWVGKNGAVFPAVIMNAGEDGGKDRTTLRVLGEASTWLELAAPYDPTGREPRSWRYVWDVTPRSTQTETGQAWPKLHDGFWMPPTSPTLTQQEYSDLRKLRANLIHRVANTMNATDEEMMDMTDTILAIDTMLRQPYIRNETRYTYTRDWEPTPSEDQSEG